MPLHKVLSSVPIELIVQHIDPDDLIDLARQTCHGHGIVDEYEHAKNNLATPYSSRYGAANDIPKYELPEDGIAANAAYQLIHDELDFDGKPNLNLASFVHTYMAYDLNFKER